MKDYKKLSQDELNKEFIKACGNNNLDIVKYLLTSIDLKCQANHLTMKMYST